METRSLVQAVKRNIERFPGDFMFRLTDDEAELLRCHDGTLESDDAESLRSQIVTSSSAFAFPTSAEIDPA